jgi:hypothetical protein
MQTKHCVGFLNVERAASAKPIKIDWPKYKFGQNLANQMQQIRNRHQAQNQRQINV